MPEDLSDLRDRVTDLRRELRAIVPLITTVAQLGERMLAVKEDIQELRDELREQKRSIDALKRMPAREREQREERWWAVKAALAGAAASGGIYVVLSLIGIGHA